MGLAQRTGDFWRTGIASWFSGRRRTAVAASGGTRTVVGRPIERDAVQFEQLADGRFAAQRTGPSRMGAENLGPTPHRQRIGSGGTTILAGRIRHEEFNPELENEHGYGRWSTQGVYDQMRKTSAKAKRALWLLKLPVLAASAEIEAVDDSDEESEIADIVSHDLFEVVPWKARLREALTMLEFGVAPFEALADVVEVPRDRFPGLSTQGRSGRPKSGETIPALLFTDFELRPAKTIHQWKARPENPLQVAELVQWASPSDGSIKQNQMPRVPGDWLLRFTWEQEAANFQGVSLFRPIYKPFVQEDQLETIDGIRHERMGCGIPVIELPDNATDADIDKAGSILSALASHEKAYLVLPSGWKFRWDVSGEGSGTDIDTRLKRLDRDMASASLADFMELGSGGDTGSFALAETQADRHLDLITLLADTALETFNRGSDGWSPVRRIVDWNYGARSRYPKVCFKNLRSKDDWAAILPLVHNFMQAKAFGPRTTYKMALEITRRLSLSPDVLPPEEEFDEKPEPAPAVGVLPEPPPAPGDPVPPAPEPGEDEETEQPEPAKEAA